MGGARGGLGGYSPRRNIVPLRKAKNNFFRDFWHLDYLLLLLIVLHIEQS